VEIEARRFVVSGRVQGVGFRWFVVDAAERLGLSGFARNLPDGDVEVVAQGTTAAIDSLQDDLRIGPRAARVHAVESSPVRPDPGLKGFHVRH
jgi:acylphosphatase